MKLLPGVFQARKKNGDIYFRSSVTFRGKHISLGSFATQEEAHKTYTIALNLLKSEIHFRPDDYRACELPFSKWVVLNNFKNNGIYIKTPIYLQTNYFNVVKLDGSLTRDILDNERNSDIIGSIMYLGRSLDFKIIAEYVETKEQRDEPERLGCNAFQGYLYSKPLKLEDLLVWMEQRKK